MEIQMFSRKFDTSELCNQNLSFLVLVNNNVCRYIYESSKFPKSQMLNKSFIYFEIV